MPGSARLDAPGVLHHIMIRGVARCKIFRTDKDREGFLECLSTVLAETALSYAWALLDNHAFYIQKRSTRNIKCNEKASYGICSKT